MAEKKKAPAVKKSTPAARKTKTVEKPAAEKIFFSKDDAYYFGQGVHYDIYKKM